MSKEARGPFLGDQGRTDVGVGDDHAALCLVDVLQRLPSLCLARRLGRAMQVCLERPPRRNLLLRLPHLFAALW